ncbi:hypothetical protein CaCOL14_000082 [Colletotrichum acutatum]
MLTGEQALRRGIMGRKGGFPSLSAIICTQPSKHPFKRAPQGYAISGSSWNSAHSLPLPIADTFPPLHLHCTTMTRSRRTKVRGGGTALSRPACHWPHDKAANSRSFSQPDCCFVSACHLFIPGSSRRRTHNSIPYRSPPLHNLLRHKRDGIIPQISISRLLMQRPFDNLRRQSFWNIVKHPCSDLRLPRKEPSK